MRGVTVELTIYDSHGADDGLTKKFNSLREALNYIFEELEGESVELCKTSEGDYMFAVEDSSGHIEYRLLVEEVLL